MKQLILTLTATLCLQMVQAEEAVKLEMKYLVGKTYIQTMHMQQEMAFTVGDTELKQEVMMDSRIIMTVTEGKKEGTRRIGISYDRISQSVDMNGQKMAYDSDKPDEGNQMMGAGLKGLIGEAFSLIMDENLNIIDIQGIDDILKNGDPATGAGMKKMFSKEYLEQIFNSNLTKALPEEPVKKGDSWDVEYAQKIPDMGGVTVTGKMSHKGTEVLGDTECVKLGNDFKMEIDLSGAGVKADPALAQMGMRIENGEMSGHTWWDTTLGYARKATFKQTMTMTMKNPQTGEQMVIPMVQTIETKVEVK